MNEQEKIDKYQNLRIELGKLQKLKVLVVLGWPTWKHISSFEILPKEYQHSYRNVMLAEDSYSWNYLHPKLNDWHFRI